jgi:peptidyl-prolyl cis-trans isomerase D
LTGLNEFNQAFFDKIDYIENKISKNINFKTIINELNINPIVIKDFLNLENNETIENKIYNSRKDKLAILEDNRSYIFYQIDKVNNKLPNLNDDKFKSKIINLLTQKNKYEFNKNILEQISEKKFNQASFDKLGIDGIETIKLNSIDDNEKFESKSIEILYSLPINNFTLIVNEDDSIFIAKTVNYEYQNISESSEEFNSISNEASAQNRNGLLKSYDYLLNSKYKVVVNEKTLDRVKNYFR